MSGYGDTLKQKCLPFKTKMTIVVHLFAWIFSLIILNILGSNVQVIEKEDENVVTVSAWRLSSQRP